MRIVALIVVAGCIAQDGPSALQESQDHDRLQKDLTELQQISDPEVFMERGAELLLALAGFQKAYPKSSNMLGVLEMQANAHQAIGRKYLHMQDPQRAQGSFSAEVGTSRELRRRVKEETDDDEETLERKTVYAEHMYFNASYYEVFALSEQEGKLEEVRSRVRALEEEFSEFLSGYEAWVWTLETAITMARTVEALARELGKEHLTEADAAWRRAFDYLAKARSWVDKRESRDDPYIREVILRSAVHEMAARQGYAALLKEVGVRPDRPLVRCLDLVEELGVVYLSLGDSTMGQALLAERKRVERALKHEPPGGKDR